MSEDYIDSFIEDLGQKPTCDWCHHPWHTKLTSRLCSHCYRIRREIVSLEREIKQKGVSLEREHDYKIALRKSQLARAEGMHYGNLHKRAISALDLEHELTNLSKKFLNKQMFYGDATSIGWALSLNQRMYVFYLLSLMQREYLRRNRHRMAQSQVTGTSLAEVEAIDHDD